MSDSLFRLFYTMFSSTSFTYPPEYYYKTCDMKPRFQRNYPCDIFDEASEICTGDRNFTVEQAWDEWQQFCTKWVVV